MQEPAQLRLAQPVAFLRGALGCWLQLLWLLLAGAGPALEDQLTHPSSSAANLPSHSPGAANRTILVGLPFVSRLSASHSELSASLPPQERTKLIAVEEEVARSAVDVAKTLAEVAADKGGRHAAVVWRELEELCVPCAGSKGGSGVRVLLALCPHTLSLEQEPAARLVTSLVVPPKAPQELVLAWLWRRRPMAYAATAPAVFVAALHRRRLHRCHHCLPHHRYHHRHHPTHLWLLRSL